MKYIYLAIITLLIAASCVHQSFQEIKEEPAPGVALYFYKQRFEKIPDTVNFRVFSKEIEYSDLIKEFYFDRNFEPAWTNALLPNKKSHKLLELLSDAEYYGLDTTYYGLNQLFSIHDTLTLETDLYMRLEYACDYELIMTNTCLLFMKHLHKGILDIDSIEYPTKNLFVNDSYLDMLENIFKNKDFKGAIIDLMPNSYQYKNMLAAYRKFISTYLINDYSIKIPDPRKDSIAAYTKAKEVLVLLGYILPPEVIDYDNVVDVNIRDSSKTGTDTTTNSTVKHSNLVEISRFDDVFINALRIFQKYHGLIQDGKIGKNTRNALELSTFDRYMSILLSLEKLKWEKEFTDSYIFVNIPSYKLEIFEEGKPTLFHKVMVGLPTHMTPTLTSDIEYFTVYPEWNVPNSISSKELLPKIKTDNEYLSRNNFTIYDKQLNLINPDEVEWEGIDSKSFNFYIKQSGGTHNALGAIKFIFPNSHFVYLHDTPSKRLFKKDIRAFSHGCVRLQNPFKFAEYILRRENRTEYIDTMYHLMEDEQRNKVNLRKKLPIHIRYYSCLADSFYNIYYYKDVYKTDKLYKQELINYRNSFMSEDTLLLSN